jgi:hypothetical protein
MSKPTRPTWEGIPETGLGADPSPGYDELRARIAGLAALRDHDHCLTAKLEAEVERCRFIAASGARDFEIQRERIAELEAENAELREKVEDAEKSRSDWADVYELTESQLTRAVELLRRGVDPTTTEFH